MIAFGPVPSRRLGRSLGVNNVPAKHCTYSCTYCQVGPTRGTEIERRAFYARDEVVAEVTAKLSQCRATDQRVDYITFVPDGEPTLDLGLAETIRDLRALRVPIAVITNGSLLHRPDVRDDLAAAALVSVKVDTTSERRWRQLNRPHPGLRLADVLAGIQEFAKTYQGMLITETMLVAGVNDDAECIEAVAAFLGGLRPARAFLLVPTRPPAKRSVRPPQHDVVARAFRLLSRRLPRVELLTEDEQGPFGRTGDPIGDLLAILAIHPMREDAVLSYLAASDHDARALDSLVLAGRVVRTRYRERTFVMLARRGGPRGSG